MENNASPIQSVSYRGADKMRDLIRDNSSLLMVMSRFGISLGFGEKTVQEICNGQKVDMPTFLAVANFISGKSYDTTQLSLISLMHYLKQAHNYFLDYNLPAIRRKLIEAINCSNSEDLAFLIIKYFDEYVQEVRKHMEYENQTVFVYVENLIDGVRNFDYDIEQLANKHGRVELKLTELENLVIRYYPEKDNYLLNAVLFDIISCEQDLASHCRVEDVLFIPAVQKIEKAMSSVELKETAEKEETASEDKFDLLSEREKEVLVCVAKGMSNKEIADHFCLSVHTVTKHRYNITGKLQIRTPAGLTIYAIAHHLVNINDLKL